MTALLAELEAFAAVNDPWLPDYQDRKAEATERLLAEVGAMADAGERAALRVWGRLTDEQAYAARNAAAGSKMHRTVPDYASIVDGERARLTADAQGIPAGADTAWCEPCRTRREVIEVDATASTYEGHHEMGWTNTHLACGHTAQSEARIIGRSPGGESAQEAMAQDATRRRLDRTSAAHDAGGY